MSDARPRTGLLDGLATFTDAVIVNLLLVVTSLPVVTFGAAWTAAPGTLLEVAREEGARPAATFLRHFTRHWKGATVAWVGVVALGVLLVWEYRVIGAMGGGWASLMVQALTVTGMLVVALWSVWAFPLLAEGHGLRRVFGLAGRLAIARLPRTALCLLLSAAPVAGLLLRPQWLVILVFVMVVVGFALVAYLQDLLLDRPLREVSSPSA